MKRPALSFEFFPPKTEDGRHKLRSTWQQLARFEPDFFSVTFGAGGSSRDNTLDTVIAIQAEGHVAAPHLSCIASNETQIRALLRKYQLHGIQRLVVLRGDMPSGEVGMGVFHHASDLVSFIRAETGTQFHLEVAAYPEFHPEASTPQDDIQHLKHKLAVGANGAITQYFYNVEAYFRLVEALEREGVTAVITPGIMPIYNITQLLRFSMMCGADIPRWLRLRLQEYGDDIASLRAFGIDVVTRLCRQLVDGGAPGLHFYTLNQADLVSRILPGVLSH